MKKYIDKFKTWNKFGSMLVIASLSISFLGGSFSSGFASDGSIIPGSFIVRVKPDFLPSEVAERTARILGIKARHTYKVAVRGFSVEAEPHIQVHDILSIPGVLHVEPDREVWTTVQVIPTGVRRIRAHENSIARIDGIDERVDVDIAIIDTGIDGSHPDLHVVGGRNFTRYGTISTWNDGNGHGTHVAGIAAALDNDFGVVGVAPGARLWAVKALDDRGGGRLSDIIAGVDWVTENANQIEVANMSLGGIGLSDILRTAIQNSVAAGVVYFVAASNEGRDVYGRDEIFNTSDDIFPAAYPEVAAISALADSDGEPGGDGPDTSYGKDDSFASFSNYSRSVVPDNPVNSPGAAIDLLLPGVSIYSTYKNGGYATLSGTSMATPHAAGLAALYIAAHGRATNAAEVYAIRQALIDRGMDQASGNRLTYPATEPDNYPENLGWAIVGSPPEVSWVHPIADAVLSGADVSVKIGASDEEDDEETLAVEWRVEGGSWNAATYNYVSEYYEAVWDTTALSDGTYNVYTRATDSNGNSKTARIVVAVDNIDDPPIISWVKPVAGDIVKGVITIKLMASDDRDSGDELIVEWRVGDEENWEDAFYNETSECYEAEWDTEALSDGTYALHARATDRGEHQSSDEISVHIRNHGELQSVLRQNYPNPVRVQTTIEFFLAAPAHAALKIYNTQGQLVKTLTDELRGAGSHAIVWNADNDAGNKVASGVYFYQLRAGDFVSMKKMVLLR